LFTMVVSVISISKMFKNELIFGNRRKSHVNVDTALTNILFLAFRHIHQAAGYPQLLLPLSPHHTQNG